MADEKKPKVFGGIKDKLVFFGPGLLLAITAAGEAGVTEALEIGAHFQLTLLWVIILTLLFKYAFTTGIARYTLATGKTIFEGFGSLPGPKNWGFILTIVSYLVEVCSIGAMILFVATFFNYLIPGTYYIPLAGIFILLLVLLVLRTHVYHHFELIMAGMVVLLSIFAVIVLSFYTATPEYFLNGLTFKIPEGSETSVLAILGVVGSGLNIMLYSVWLERRIRKKKVAEADHYHLGNQSFFRRYIRSVRLDILIGFLIVAVVTVAFMEIGHYSYLWSFLPHEGITYSVDLLVSQVSTVFNVFPFGVYFFLIFVTLIFFGAATVGLDARTTAVMKTLIKMRETGGKKVTNHSRVYNICLGVFALFILGAILINEPMHTIRTVSVICAILFGIFGFMLLYLDSKLPEYARGSRFWMLFIGIGSALSIFVALLLQGSILDLGFPLLKEMMIFIAVLFLFTRTKMFKRIMAGMGNISDKFWLVVIFGALSVYASLFGILLPGTDNIIINFRDLGPVIAGLLGGPVVGVFAGLVGGLFRLGMGGVTAVPCCIGTIAAGLMAGIAVRMWKGKITVPRLIGLGAAAECFHLLFVFPTYEFITSQMTVPAVLDVIFQAAPSMTIVMVMGLLLFYLFIRKTPLVKEAENPLSLSRLKDELKSLFKKGGDST